MASDYPGIVSALGRGTRIFSKCESLQDLKRFGKRLHTVLTEALGLDGAQTSALGFNLSLLLHAGGCGSGLRFNPRLDDRSDPMGCRESQQVVL